MIPILFEKGRTEFIGNGIGRLSDAVSCIVTEERNGGFTLDMEYAEDGIHEESIQPGCIIFADSSDKGPQPFDVVTVTRNYGETVKVEARHISYRLTGIPVRTRSGSSSLSASNPSDALTNMQSYIISTFDASGWNFSTYKSNIGTWKPENPLSVRACLMGEEGSILDAFGGEYEWDGYNVILHDARGSDNGVSIRYGKNIKSIEHDVSNDGSYNGCYGYWEKGDSFYQPSAGAQLLDSNIPYSFAKIVNFSADFDERPSYAELIAKDQEEIIGKDKDSLSISVSLATGYSDSIDDISMLESVHLCDTVHVIFEPYGIDVTTKVVKTVYDTLLDRLDSVEIGTVKTTLADTIANGGNVTNNFISGGSADYDERISALETATAALQTAMSELSLTTIGATKLGSVGTTQSTITLPLPTAAYLIVTTHNSTTNNNGLWIVRGASGVFKIGGGSNITITKNNGSLTVKSSSGNSDLYAIRLG